MKKSDSKIETGVIFCDKICSKSVKMVIFDLFESHFETPENHCALDCRSKMDICVKKQMIFGQKLIFLTFLTLFCKSDDFSQKHTKMVFLAKNGVFH